MKQMTNSVSFQSKKGMVLLIVLGILGLLSVLAISFVQVAKLEQAISKNYVDRTRAIMAAESGIEYAVARIRDLQGGALTAEEYEQFRYEENPATPGLVNAIKPSFPMVAPDGDLSGILNDMQDHREAYKLKVIDESGKLNLNDSNGLWNIDSDPLLDSEEWGQGDDADLAKAFPRLFKVFESLVNRLFDRTGVSGIGADAALALFAARDAASGGRFSSWSQVQSALVDPGNPTVESPLTLLQFQTLRDYTTLWSWQDPNVLRPTFQLHVSMPADLIPTRATIAEEHFNIYLYSDFQTGRFALEPRAPTNVNTMKLPLLESLIAPVQGWYLYEGLPSSMMDAKETSPWVKSLRATSFCWDDTVRHAGWHDNPTYEEWGGYKWNSPTTENETFGNRTRYGRAQLTTPFGKDITSEIALQIYNRIHDAATPQPFHTWDEFTRFLYSLVDDTSTIVADVDSSLETQRFPYRLEADSSFSSSAIPVTGFDRYMADALLANFNPNTRLNDHNPDFHIFRHVDKTQLTRYTTELSFQPTGYFSIESMGLVQSKDGSIQSKVSIQTVMQIFYLLRHTAQSQFMAGFDVNTPDSLYSLLEESAGDVTTSGADIQHGSGDLLAGGRHGPSLVSYPEPIRNANSLSMQEHPDGAADWFSRYEGYLSLATYQPTTDIYTSIAGEAPMFMASMGYRYLDATQQANWRDTSLGAGGLLPVRFGWNDKVETDNTVTHMNIPGGRAVMLTWNKDYSLSLGEWEITGVAPEGPDASWTLSAPWEDQKDWKKVTTIYADHNAWIPEAGMAWSPVGPFRNVPQLNGLIPVGKNIRRVAWNTPSDLPVTPDREQSQVQGILYPDGAFSDVGRLLSYPATNLGSNWGHHGAIGFWIKPHWNTGYSNRIRQLFSVGHMGTIGTHALDLLYFPAAPRPQDPGYSRPGDEVTWTWRTHPVTNIGPQWPIPTHSFFFGMHSIMQSGDPRRGYGELSHSEPDNIVVSPTATDFFPGRNSAERSSHEAFGFYGHQWNYIGMSYKNFTEPNDTSEIWRYSINGIPVPGLPKWMTGEDWHPSSGGPDRPAIPYKWVNSIWEEKPYFPIVSNVTGEPEFTHMGSRYMRFGWGIDNSGPVGDSTYDEIVTFANPVLPSVYTELWQQGRYAADPIAPAGSDQNVVGLFTSSDINLRNSLHTDVQLLKDIEYKLHSVSWTCLWPRYNWRPDNTAGDDWETWGSSADYNGITGVDIHDGMTGSNVPEADPVTGAWDPILVDILNADGKWQFSEDNPAAPNPAAKYNNLTSMPSFAGGSSIPNNNTSAYHAGDAFQYRVYFLLEQDQSLLESPVLDDITFVFLRTKPEIFFWELTSDS